MSKPILHSAMTLIETVIAVAIFSIVMFIALSTFTSFTSLKTSSDTVINTSQQARSIFEKITRDLRELDTLDYPIFTSTTSFTLPSISFTLRDSSGRSGYCQKTYSFNPDTKKLTENSIFYKLDPNTGTYLQTVSAQETNILNQGNLAIDNFSFEFNANNTPGLMGINITFNQQGSKVQERFKQTLESYVLLSNKSN